MTYYYSPHDDYKGFYDIKKSSSMKNALAGLRRSLVKNDQEAGMIATTPLPKNLGSRNPKGYVGTMIVISGKRKTIKDGGRRLPIVSYAYMWVPKGMRKAYTVKSDGSLTELERR